MDRILQSLECFEQRYTYRVPVALVMHCLLVIGVGVWGVQKA
jgi:hypothetical protein